MNIYQRFDKIAVKYDLCWDFCMHNRQFMFVHRYGEPIPEEAKKEIEQEFKGHWNASARIGYYDHSRLIHPDILKEIKWRPERRF